jgi:hypothetical protein
VIKNVAVWEKGGLPTVGKIAQDRRCFIFSCRTEATG